MTFTRQLKQFLLATLLFTGVLTAAHASEDILDAVEDAMDFWENRNGTQYGYWAEIHAALDGGELSDDLMERVSQSWANAKPGGKMYETWKAVFAALTAKSLQDSLSVMEQEQQQESQQEIPATEETEVEVPAAVIEAVEDAMEFWENRNADKFAFWREVLEALNGAEISDELMEKVSQSWANAKSGGRMYNTWKGVFEAFTGLRAEPEDPPKPVEQDGVGDTDNVVDWEIPDVQPEDAPEDLVVLQSDENNNNPVQPAWYSPPQVVTPPPAWFNPGGGYSLRWYGDGYAGWYTTQWGEEFQSGSTTEDRCDDSGVCRILVPRPEYPGVDCSIEKLKCEPVTNPDGIPDYTYHSYEDAAFTHPRWGAKMAWGEWGKLPSDVRAAVAGIDLPSLGEIAAELGATATGYGFFPSSGTATYEGEAKGVFRPDLFGTVYGTRDDPSTADKNEYDDGGPRVSLTANFEKGLIDGELTARMTAQRLGFGPPVRQSLGLEEGYRWHSAHSHFFECPDSTCAETYTAVRASSKNDGDGTYVHGRIETTVDVDEMLRTPVVRWNGIRIAGTDDFEGQGLYGEVIATCSSGSGSACFWSDATAAIRGYINHSRFVGSYGAAKCASDGTCPGFEMPDLVPGTVGSYDSWGPWDDLPLATRQTIAGLSVPDADTFARSFAPGDVYYGTTNTSFATYNHRRVNVDASTLSGTATFSGDVIGAINPRHSDLSSPMIELTADFDSATLNAGITYERNGVRTGALDSWTGIALTAESFAQDGLTGTFKEDSLWSGSLKFDNTVFGRYDPRNFVVGTVHTPHAAGVYRADEQ